MLDVRPMAVDHQDQPRIQRDTQKGHRTPSREGSSRSEDLNDLPASKLKKLKCIWSSARFILVGAAPRVSSATERSVIGLLGDVTLRRSGPVPYVPHAPGMIFDSSAIRTLVVVPAPLPKA